MLANISKDLIDSMNLNLTGKTAIITGGAAGIGSSTAEFFLKQGANVVLADLNPDVVKFAKELGGDHAIGVPGNVCDRRIPRPSLTRRWKPSDRWIFWSTAPESWPWSRLKP